MGCTRSYKIHDFAKLAGVTVKALHHYDRLGLLTAKRNPSGYRAFGESDLERLEQIVALKYLGLPLKQIKALLDRKVLALPDALRAQRLALEKSQRTLARAIRAIHAAEASLELGQPTDPSVLRTIIQVINMQEGIEEMKKYYDEAGWKLRQQYYEEGPAREWLDLYRDANALLQADPASAEAQAVADRWLALSVRAYRGDEKVQTDSPTAWADRHHWPAVMKQRISEFNLEEVTDFLQRVALHSRRKYFSDSSWARFLELRKQAADDPEIPTRAWQAHVDLFRDIVRAQDEDPAGRIGQDLARRWIAIQEAESGGDAEIFSSLVAAWLDRAHWSATLRWRMEGLAMLSGEIFERAADFIVQAAAVQYGENTLTLSEVSFGEDVLRTTVPVLVSVWAEGCTGCARLAPFVDLVAREFNDRAKVGKLNAMANMGLAMQFEVRALPTVLLFIDGQVVERRMGPISLVELRRILAELTGVAYEPRP